MLTGKNIQLRYLNQSDLEFLYDIENDETLWKFGSEKQYLSKKSLSEYIENSKLDIEISQQFRFVIDLKQTPIGIIDLYSYNGTSAGIGILIVKKYRKNGFAKESLALIKDYCFKTLKLQELFCVIAADNLESTKLFTSIGFKEKSEFKKLKHFNLKS